MTTNDATTTANRRTDAADEHDVGRIVHRAFADQTTARRRDLMGRTAFGLYASAYVW